MNLHVVDNFLDDFTGFRNYMDGLEFTDKVNPVDGLTYPGINLMIPPTIFAEVITKLQQQVGARIEKATMLMRMTLDGVTVPHGVHTDATMGQCVMILFLNRERDCEGGTALVSHRETGMKGSPTDGYEQSVWERDHNDYNAWNIETMVDMVPNRAMIFDADKMHRAELPHAFGDSTENGRVVMSCFFTVY